LIPNSYQKALGLLLAFEESINWVLLSLLYGDSNLHLYVCVQVTSRHHVDWVEYIRKIFNRKSISPNTSHRQS